MLFSTVMVISMVLSCLNMTQCQPSHKGSTKMKHGFWHKEKKISNTKKQHDAKNDVIPQPRDSIQEGQNIKSQKVQKMLQRSGINTNPTIRYSQEKNVVKTFTPTKIDLKKNPPQYNTGDTELKSETGEGNAAAPHPVVGPSMARAQDIVGDTMNQIANWELKNRKIGISAPKYLETDLR